MTKTSITARLCVGLVLATTFTSLATPTFAQTQGTAEQRAACTPDVFRLCMSEIPNVTKIVACLKKEKPKLSPGCRAVFNS